ncbi:MAG: T9SS type A sorting domain-containing protein [Ignavibacteriales bacterium]|nr:T9SS type A sorting domain-containing protein [Ignavibacteriales bacterium]
MVSNSTSTTSDLTVFQDALQSPWINSSWSAITTFGSIEQFYTGTSSIKTALTSAWGGLSLHYGNWNSSPGVNSSQYVSLDFAVFASTAGTQLSIFAENDLGQSFPKVNTAVLAANQWTVISIPMSQLSPSGQVIHRLSLQEISGSAKTFYVDNLRFVGSAPAPAPPPVAPSLALPANGATSVAINPTLSWNASTGATTYRAQVSASSSFATTTVDQSAISATSLSVSALSNNTTYYWRVTATNSNGTSVWSSTSTFATVALIAVADTTKPVVAFTGPLNGTTVSGTIGITANATDNIKVMGVQFKLDGANLGAELRAAPYNYSLNTTTLSNGSHTLSAVARDSTGNQATSSVTVTVANSVPLSSADLMVYQDALQTPWINASWSATVTFGSSEQIASGTSSIKVAQNAWGALRLHSGAWGTPVDVKASSYTGLSFAIHGGLSGVSLGVYFENDLSQSFPAAQYIWVAANQWKTMSFSMSQLNPNNQVIHRLVIQDMTGRVKTFYIDDLKFTTAPVLAVKVGGTGPESSAGTNTPVSFGLGQNYPNPFNPSTVIQYSLPMQAYVTMEIYNTLGQRVHMLVDQQQAVGEHQVQFNASSLPSGVYFYRLTARPSDGSAQQPFVSMKRMILTK